MDCQPLATATIPSGMEVAVTIGDGAKTASLLLSKAVQALGQPS